MKKFLPLIVIVLFAISIYYVLSTPPQANKRGQQKSSPLVVEVLSIKPQRYQVNLSSFGKIKPTSEGQLSAQVSGKVTSVSENFKAGSFFSKGDVLVTLDDRDYTIRVQSASAERAQATVALDEEIALSAQAIKDRRNLGTLGQASDYALRKPQMAAAQASLQAADANLKLAMLDVERTQITAPYDGRILTKNVSLGQVVNNSTVIANIYAVNSAQIDLPIKNSQLALINLPNNHTDIEKQVISEVTIFNNDGGEVQSWPAKLARTSGGVDDNTQQISIISEIDSPFGQSNKRSLNIGQFVTATIVGKVINDAIVIPNAAIYQGSYVYLYKEGALQRSSVKVIYQNNTDALIASGVNAGDQLVTTPLGQVNSGTAVRILGAKDSRLKNRKKGRKDGQSKRSRGDRKKKNEGQEQES